jgi:hypothetical protein
VAYIPTLQGARWENWRGDWVIASVEANDRLALPSDGPALDRKQWRAKPSLAPKFLPVLDRIKTLASGRLTSMHVVGDFLKRRIAPLQRRARLCRWFTGSNDISRIQRGPGTDLSWDELEVRVKGITGESFIPESLILPKGIPALCDDPGLRTAILATLPTLDESGMAVRQTGGRDPHCGIRISDASAGGPQLAGVAPSAPAAAPRPLDKGKGAASSSSALGGTGGQRKRGDTVYAAPTGRLLRTPPPPDGDEEAGSQKRQRTAGGAKEAGSQAQGAQRRVSPPPPPPPPSGPPPPPPPGGNLPQGHQQQQQRQQQQQQQRSPRFQGRWKVQGPK